MLIKKTMNLPKELLEEVAELAQSPTQTMVVILALQDFVRKKKMEKLLNYKGKNNRTCSIFGVPDSLQLGMLCTKG